MGFRFRKSFKIMPGVRLNLSKSGLSTSIGGKGVTLNLSKRGVRSTAGIPGTGLSYSTLLASNRRDQGQDDTLEPREDRESSERARSDSASSAPLVWAIVITLLLGWLLPSMSWWAYVLIFVLTMGVFSFVARSAINPHERTPDGINELDIPQPEPRLRSPTTALSTPNGIGEIIPSRDVNDIRVTPPEPKRTFAIGVASAAIGATAFTLVLLPLMQWWVYLTVFPAVALSIIFFVNWRMR